MNIPNISIAEFIARNNSLKLMLNTEPNQIKNDQIAWHSYIVVIGENDNGTMFFADPTEAMQYLCENDYNGYIFNFWGSIHFTNSEPKVVITKLI